MKSSDKKNKKMDRLNYQQNCIPKTHHLLQRKLVFLLIKNSKQLLSKIISKTHSPLREKKKFILNQNFSFSFNKS